MLNIGCHLSASKGYYNMGKEALSINANTFQFFTRNPRGGKAKEVNVDDVKKFLELAKENNFCKILAHAPYTINVCSADEGIRRFGIDTMKDDLKNLEYVPYNMYNFHPGSHVGQGEEVGIQLIIDALNEILKEEQSTTVLLETMAGKGTEVGKTFEQLKKIIDGVMLARTTNQDDYNNAVLKSLENMKRIALIGQNSIEYISFLLNKAFLIN